MTASRFEKLCMELVEEIRNVAPVDTGNLKNNAIRFEFIDENTFKIYVDESIAPYMPYTNEIWLSERWINKKTGIKAKNPNEGWWSEKAVGFVVNFMKQLKVERIKEND